MELPPPAAVEGVVRTLLRGILACVLTVGVSSPAAACLDRSMMRRVLVQAHPDVRACVERHDLAGGRYAVRATVDMTTGKVEQIDVVAAPNDIGAPAQSCIEAAFTRLQFPSISLPPPRAPMTRSGGGRVSRVPAPSGRGRGPSVAVIMWPFVLER